MHGDIPNIDLSTGMGLDPTRSWKQQEEAAARSSGKRIPTRRFRRKFLGRSLRMANPIGNSGLTLMLWRLKTLWRLGGGVRRECAGVWYSVGLARVGELAQRPSGTWEFREWPGSGGGSERSPWKGVSAGTRTERERGKSGNCAGSRVGIGIGLGKFGSFQPLKSSSRKIGNG